MKQATILHREKATLLSPHLHVHISNLHVDQGKLLLQRLWQAQLVQLLPHQETMLRFFFQGCRKNKEPLSPCWKSSAEDQ